MPVQLNQYEELKLMIPDMCEYFAIRISPKVPVPIAKHYGLDYDDSEICIRKTCTCMKPYCKMCTWENKDPVTLDNYNIWFKKIWLMIRWDWQTTMKIKLNRQLFTYDLWDMLKVFERDDGKWLSLYWIKELKLKSKQALPAPLI